MPSQSSPTTPTVSHDTIPDGEVEFKPWAPQGRRYSTHTKLGKLMTARGFRVYTVSGRAAIAPRTLGYYLAGTKPISAEHLTRLCEVLNCEPEELVEEPIEDM